MVGVFAVLTGGAGGNGAAATGAAAATGGAGGASCVDVFTTCVVVGGPVTGGAGGVGGPVPSFFYNCRSFCFCTWSRPNCIFSRCLFHRIFLYHRFKFSFKAT